MDLIKQQGNVIKQIGGSLTAPFISKAVNSFVDNVTGETSKSQDDKIKALEAEVAAGRKTKEQAEMEALQKANQGMKMKKGGKVSSASKRADGIAIRGRTRA